MSSCEFYKTFKNTSFVEHLQVTSSVCSDLLSIFHPKITYNPGHDILELYNVLVPIQVTTSKTKLDIQYNKLGIRVASRVAEWLKT